MRTFKALLLLKSGMKTWFKYTTRGVIISDYYTSEKASKIIAEDLEILNIEDKNGENIFEDCIIKITIGGVSSIRKLIFDNKTFSWVLYSKIIQEKCNNQNYNNHLMLSPFLGLGYAVINYPNSFEIIGNFYENPELLL